MLLATVYFHLEVEIGLIHPCSLLRYFLLQAKHLENPTVQNSQPISMDDAQIIELGLSLTERAIVLLNSHAIYPDSLQKKMLETHIKAMVWRSFSGESLPELDMEMFDEISPICFTLAEQVCHWMESLAYEEAHLLSVHFEVAKENELNPTAGETTCQ